MNKLVLDEKELLGETLLKYREIATIMNSFPLDQEISVDQIAEVANVHWKTAKKALAFFCLSKPIIPDFTIDNNFKIRIVKKPQAMKAIDIHFESDLMKILTKMLIKKMINLKRGLTIDLMKLFLLKQEIGFIPSLIEKGYINSEEGVYYLSERGKIIANMGIQKITDMGYQLPWDEVKDNFRVLCKNPLKTYSNSLYSKKTMFTSYKYRSIGNEFINKK